VKRAIYQYRGRSRATGTSKKWCVPQHFFALYSDVGTICPCGSPGRLCFSSKWARANQSEARGRRISSRVCGERRICRSAPNKSTHLLLLLFHSLLIFIAFLGVYQTCFSTKRGKKHTKNIKTKAMTPFFWAFGNKEISKTQ
jgi:hypothetical protein